MMSNYVSFLAFPYNTVLQLNIITEKGKESFIVNEQIAPMYVLLLYFYIFID